jgi:uncharacterized protein (TIGR00266 family)
MNIPNNSKSEYDFSVSARPEFSFLTVKLKESQSIVVEAAGMATKDVNVKMTTKARGGFSRFLTGEGIFVNHFQAEGGAGEISIAPPGVGDLGHYRLDGSKSIFLQNSGFVAASPEIKLETKWQGLLKGFFSGESFFLIRCSGVGDLFFNTFGSMIEIDKVDREVLVDTGHIVAFTEGLEYDISRIGGYKSLFFSGEGLVARFRGQGKIWIQTRKASRFVSWASYFRPVRSV